MRENCFRVANIRLERALRLARVSVRVRVLEKDGERAAWDN